VVGKIHVDGLIGCCADGY